MAEPNHKQRQKSVWGSLNASVEIEETLSDVVIVNVTFLFLFVHHY